jgi:hypothetical protein
MGDTDRNPAGLFVYSTSRLDLSQRFLHKSRELPRGVINPHRRLSCMNRANRPKSARCAGDGKGPSRVRLDPAGLATSSEVTAGR